MFSKGKLILLSALLTVIPGCPDDRPKPPRSGKWSFKVMNAKNGAYDSMEFDKNGWLSRAVLKMKVKFVCPVPGAEEYLNGKNVTVEAYALETQGVDPHVHVWCHHQERIDGPMMTPGLGKFMGIRCQGPFKHIPFSFKTDENGEFEAIVEFDRRIDGTTDQYYSVLTKTNYIYLPVVYRVQLSNGYYVYGGFAWDDSFCTPSWNFITCSKSGQMTPEKAKQLWPATQPKQPQVLLASATSYQQPPNEDCGCQGVNVDNDGDSVLDCHDLCPNDKFKIQPGICGCGQPEADTDGDGFLDCQDACPNNSERSVPPCHNSDGDLDTTDGREFVNFADMTKFATYYTGPGIPAPPVNLIADFDDDGDVDQDDFGLLQRCYTGWSPKIPNCIDLNR